MKFRLLLLCLIGALLPAICAAQGDFRPGYIIKNNRDSLTGFVDYRVGTKAWNVAYYRATKRDVTVEFRPDQIVAYGFRGNKRFESVIIPETGVRQFAEVLVKGTMSLYKYEGHFYVSEDSLVLLSKGKDKVIQTKNGTYVRPGKAYVATLNMLLTECNLRADNTPLSEIPLVSLIQNYNRCKGEAGKVYKEEQPRVLFNFHVLAGVNLASLTADNLDKSVFRKDRAFVVGGGLDVSLPKFTDRIFLTLEATYQDYTTHGYNEIAAHPKIRRTDYFIDASFLKIPVGVRYNFRHDTRTPYLKAGLVKVFDMGSELREFDDVQDYSTVTTSAKTYELESIGKNGYWFGVGYGRVIRGKVRGFVEIRYEKVGGFKGYDLLEGSKLTTTSLMLGIRL